MTMASHDVEKGLGAGTAVSVPAPSTSSAPSHGEKTQRRSDLETFQTLVGICFLAEGGGFAQYKDRVLKPSSPMEDIFRPSKASEGRFRNRGLYYRALTEDQKNRTLYVLSHYALFSLHILQILLAATITAISAYHDISTVALTVLGAVNTVVAGLLAWLTGQGMPTRFRRARDQYRDVVKAIEATERMFAEIDFIDWPDGKRPDPVVERDRLEKLFEQARTDEEANYPDMHYTPPSDLPTKESKDLKEAAEKWKEEIEAKGQELEAARQELEALKKSMKGILKDAETDVTNLLTPEKKD